MRIVRCEGFNPARLLFFSTSFQHLTYLESHIRLVKMLLKFFIILLSVSGLTLSTPVQDNFEWSKISCESMSTPVSDGRTFDRTPSFFPDLFQLGDSYTSIGYQGKSKGEIFDYIDPQATTAGASGLLFFFHRQCVCDSIFHPSVSFSSRWPHVWYCTDLEPVY